MTRTQRWAVAVLLISEGLCSARYLRAWQDDRHLWQHAVQVDPKNPRAHVNLAKALFVSDPEASEREGRQAVSLGGHR